MIDRCIDCYYYKSKENLCTLGSPIFIDDICTDYQDSEFVYQIRAEAIDDFVRKISESNQGHWRVTRYEHGEVVSETMSYDIGTIRLIAEQLKAGD